MNSPGQPDAIDDLLDQAVAAAGRGDRAAANVLAEQVIALESGNAEAEDLLAAPADQGEIRRLTIMFADLVDSTALSTHAEPEIYRTVVGRYQREVTAIVERYEGHLGSMKGDGLLVLFGHPQAHEDDAQRAVQAGLDITRDVALLSTKVRRRFGFDIDVRVGINHGVVYLDIAEDDVYGFAANLASRICTLAAPGTVEISESVERLVGRGFELKASLPRTVKGVDVPVRSYRVIAEKDPTTILMGELVGRDRESDYLNSSWAEARTGDLRTPGVLLRGEAGLGKSRLAWSVTDTAEKSHAVVLTLLGSPFHTDVGLRPVRRLLERRCGIGRTSEAAESLRLLEHEVARRMPDRADLVPLLAPVLGIATGYRPAAAEGRKLYEQIAAAVRDYLLACVRDAPALILVEDMHWFDEDTVELVQNLLATDLGGHVMVVMTSRGDVDLPTESHVVFDLQPLTDDEADRLITSLYPLATEEERETMRRRGDGVPLFIEEIAAKVKEQPANGASSPAVPDTLYDALFARLRSSSGAVRVAEAAAIAGSRFDRHLLHAVVDLSEDEIDDAIEQLVDGRVLQPLEDDNWRFRHELLREVAVELSPPSVRQRLHSLLADAMTSSSTRSNPDWPLIAQHYAKAERFTEAAAGYTHAAANAAKRGALGESRTYLSHALAQVSGSAGGQDRDRMEIRLRLQRAFLAQAAEGVSSPNAAADFERCLQLTSNDLQDDDLFSTVMSLFPYYAMRADLDRTERLVQSIRTSLTGEREWFLPINECALGMLAWYRGDFALARDKLDIAAETLTLDAAAALDAQLFMPNDPTAGLYAHRALARAIDGDLAGAEAELTKAEEQCARLAFPKGAFSSAYSRQLEVMIRIEAGQFDRAGATALDIARLGDQHGFDSWTLVGAAQQMAVTAMAAVSGEPAAQDLAPYIAALTMFVDAGRDQGVIALSTFYDALLVRLLTATGALDEARDRVRLALEVADRTGMHCFDAELLRLRALTHSDADTRHADLVAATELARSQDARIFELRATTDDFELMGEASREALVRAIGRLPADSDWPDLTHARALLG